MNEIFISYSRRDKVFVERFLTGLKDSGYASDSIWVDWEDIPASSDWEAEIKKGIETANSIIFILSPEWAKSGECAKELRFATEYNKRLFPIVWQNVDPNTIQKELASLNWIFFRETDNFEDAMQKLLAALKTDLGWVAQHTTLLTRANEWNAKKRDNGYLLRGSELQEAETWLSQASVDKQPQPSPLQKEYIFTSRQDDVRRQRRTLIGVTVAMVVSIALAIAAVISGMEALQQSQKALASQLAAQSSSLVSTQPDLSLLLSLESNYIGDELGQSDAALLGSLVTSLNSSPKLETYLREHEYDVRAVTFSPDGHWLATAGGSPNGDIGEVLLWDLKSKDITHQAKKLSVDSKRFLGVTFSPDSKQLFAAGNDKKIYVWDVQNCCTPATIPVKGTVRALAIATVNGREYIATAEDNQVLLWDAKNPTAEPAFTFLENDGSKGRVLSLAVSSKNELAAGGEDGYVTVWDLNTQQMKFRACSYGDAPANQTPECETANDYTDVRGLAFNPQGTLLVSGSSDHRAWLWNAQTGELLAKSAEENEGGHINTVASVAFSPKSNQVATVSWDNTVKLWNLIQQGDKWSFERTDTLAGHANSIWAVAYSPDGKRVASGSSDATVILWKLDQINQIGTPIAKMDGETWALTAAPNGKQFAAGDAAGNIRIWNFDGTKLSEPLKLTHAGGVLTLAYSHDNKWLASAGSDHVIRVWNTQTGQEAWQVADAHTDDIWSLMFSPNDKWLASASYDQTVKIWDTATHDQVGKSLDHTAGVFALTFNEDGTKLLVAGYSQDIFVWDVSNPADFKSLDPLQGHSATVNSLAYNWANPPLLTSTSDDKSLLIWDVTFAEPSPKVLGLNESMEAVTFNPRGDWLASATDNKTVLLWQLDAERCAQAWDPPTCQPARLGTPLAGHAAPVENVVFLTNDTLVSSDQDGQLILWNLNKKYWYNRACGIVNRKFNSSDPEYIQYIEGKINTKLLNIVNWFSDRFGSGVVEAPPACIGNN